MMVKPHFVKSFRDWLSEQPLDRQLEIYAAESVYLKRTRESYDVENGGMHQDPVEQAFLESMEGWIDSPA